jgi:hypothetical protein
MSEEYNGWKNRETWATALHINNDEGLQNEMEEKVETLIDLFEGEEDEVVSHLAEWLEEWISNLVSARWWRDEYGCEMSMGAEMIREDIGSLWRVDWREVAENLSSDELESYNREKEEVSA